MTWNEHYRERNTPWDLGAPSAAVAHAVGLATAPPARVLVPGFGYGWDVEALAGLGYEVVGLEVAAEAIALAAERIGAHPRVELREGDLFDPPADLTGTFDVVAEHTCYCAFDPERWPDYAEVAGRLLRPGGAVAGAFLDFEGGGPPFGTNIPDLRAIFEPRFAIERLEPWPDPFPKLECPQIMGVLRVRDR